MAQQNFWPEILNLLAKAKTLSLFDHRSLKSAQSVSSIKASRPTSVKSVADVDVERNDFIVKQKTPKRFGFPWSVIV